MTDDIHASIATRLAQSEGRYTGGRRALVDVLLAAGRPLTAQEILDRSPQVRQSSVYRNLAVFEDSGLVHRVSGHDEFTRYELAEEIVGHHHHFACRSCGGVADVELPHDVEEALTRTLADLATRTGHTVEAHRLDVVGLCHDCTVAQAR
jgi:Fur family transcriptional regulator, ferric uptake regulator